MFYVEREDGAVFFVWGRCAVVCMHISWTYTYEYVAETCTWNIIRFLLSQISHRWAAAVVSNALPHRHIQKFLLNNNNHWDQRGKYDKCTEQCTPVRAFCTFRPWQLHSQRPYRARCERSREKWVGCLSSSIAYRFTINLQIYMNTTWFHSCTAIEMKMLQYILVRARVK